MYAYKYFNGWFILLSYSRAKIHQLRSSNIFTVVISGMVEFMKQPLVTDLLLLGVKYCYNYMLQWHPLALLGLVPSGGRGTEQTMLVVNKATWAKPTGGGGMGDATPTRGRAGLPRWSGGLLEALAGRCWGVAATSPGDNKVIFNLVPNYQDTEQKIFPLKSRKQSQDCPSISKLAWVKKVTSFIAIYQMSCE